MNQRSDRVAESMKRVISELLQQHRIKDVRISGLVSITEVELSGDLYHAKVYVSVYGDEATQQQTMEGLQSAVGFIRSEVGKALHLRTTPEIHFKLDQSAAKAAEINALLQRIKQDREEREEREGQKPEDQE